jgi:hypothetical protein
LVCPLFKKATHLFHTKQSSHEKEMSPQMDKDIHDRSVMLDRIGLWGNERNRKRGEGGGFD